MRIQGLEIYPVSVPYTHRERSSQVDRDGVSDVLVKLRPITGVVGWGESCTGADAGSIVETLRAMAALC